MRIKILSNRTSCPLRLPKKKQNGTQSEAYAFESAADSVSVLTEADQEVGDLVSTYFDTFNTMAEVVQAYKETMTKDLIDGMSISVKVHLRHYLALKGHVFPPRTHVIACLYSLLDEQASPSPQKSPIAHVSTPETVLRTDEDYRTRQAAGLARTSNAVGNISAHLQSAPLVGGTPLDPTVATARQQSSRCGARAPYNYCSLGNLPVLPQYHPGNPKQRSNTPQL